MGLVRARLLSFGLILAVAFLLMASLVVSAVLAAIGSWMGSLLPGWEVLLHLINACVSIAIPAGQFNRVLSPLMTRSGATSPLASSGYTVIDGSSKLPGPLRLVAFALP